MKVVIPYKTSVWAGEELKFAIRSYQMYVKDFSGVVVIGDKPDWYIGEHMAFKDSEERAFKERNIMQKLSLYCNVYGGDFVLGNDDVYLLQPYLHDFFYSGYLAPSQSKGVYAQTKNNTYQLLTSLDKPVKYFDIHCPIVYNSEMFLAAMGVADWNTPHGYVIKSLYSNFHNIEGKQCSDLKFNSQKPYFALRRDTEKRTFFSVGDRTIGVPLRRILTELYPKKSDYERK